MQVMKTRHCKTVLTAKIAATLDCINTSVRKTTMIMVSVLNEAGGSSVSLQLSKSTVHRHHQQLCELSSRDVKQTYKATKSVVHCDGKLIPRASGSYFIE